MRVNIENASAMRDPSMKPWLLDELVRNLKEVRDRSNAGDMQAAVTEFFEVFRFSDNQTDPSPVRAALAAQPGAVGEPSAEMINRFLNWKLPADFHPDCGISFKPESDYDHPEFGRTKYQPFGTNLLNYEQAREMLRYVLAAAPTEEKPAQDVVDAERWREASRSRNHGITAWGEFGQRTVYDSAADQLIDAAISAKKVGAA